MVGEFIMTEHECVGHKPVADGVGYGAYALDSHTCNRIVVEGRVENEGNYFIKGFDPYAIAYRSLLRTRDQLTNLVVPVFLWASTACFVSIQLDPGLMGLGQTAGFVFF